MKKRMSCPKIQVVPYPDGPKKIRLSELPRQFCSEECGARARVIWFWFDKGRRNTQAVVTSRVVMKGTYSLFRKCSIPCIQIESRTRNEDGIPMGRSISFWHCSESEFQCLAGINWGSDETVDIRCISRKHELSSPRYLRAKAFKKPTQDFEKTESAEPVIVHIGAKEFACLRLVSRKVWKGEPGHHLAMLYVADNGKQILYERFYSPKSSALRHGNLKEGREYTGQKYSLSRRALPDWVL